MTLIQMVSSHYLATVKRGKITDTTTTAERIEQIKSEVKELEEAEDIDTFSQELMDIVYSCFNTAINLGINIEKEMIKNLLHQQKRTD